MMHIDEAHTLAQRSRRKATRTFTPVELNALSNAIATARHFSPSTGADPVTAGLLDGWVMTR